MGGKSFFFGFPYVEMILHKHKVHTEENGEEKEGGDKGKCVKIYNAPFEMLKMSHP